MKKIILLGLMGLAVLMMLTGPAAAADPALYFTAPGVCVNPGDVVTYSVNGGYDAQNPGDWGSMEFTWDPGSMDLVNVGLFAYGGCRSYYPGELYCRQPGYSPAGDIKLKVRDTVPAGTHLTVGLSATYEGDSYGFNDNRQVTTVVCPNIPEFPSVFLPLAMIIGFLAAVLFISRTIEH
jgi:hypothetical protein